MKSVLTPKQAAIISSISPQKIRQQFDAGHLKGYRVPGSRHRRIPLDSLQEFMRDNGIPRLSDEALPLPARAG